MQPHSLLSVGIDVGTTTTQVVFSRLTLQDTARAGQVPRIGITDKAVLYQSPVFFTPLADWDTVDAARLTEQVRREYAAAGLPVVSSDLPQVRRCSDIAACATDIESWITALRAAVAKGSDRVTRREQSERVRAQDWSGISDRMTGLLIEASQRTGARG